jgi:arylsulfatase A-like enzyme
MKTEIGVTASPISRRQWLGLAGAVVAGPRVTVRPNVLLILADQFPAYATGFAGDPQARTPNLDRLARQGARFTNAISNCPVCTPYRAMLQTGRWPLATGMIANDVRLPETEYTMGEAFRDAGYQTGYIGKWHLDGPERWGFTPPGPRRQGYDFWAVNNCNHNYTNTYYYRDTPQPIPVSGYEPIFQTKLFKEFLTGRDKKKPFLMQLSWGPPHPPYHLLPEALKIFRPEGIKPRSNMQNPNLQNLADFYSQIAALDTEMGRILEALDQEGIADDTVVLFTADHGDMLGSHGKWDKQIWYEESVNVPFLLRYPRRVEAGLKLEALINAVDILPTLLSLAGLGMPRSVEGADVSRALLGKRDPGQDASLIAGYMPFARQAYHYPEWRGVRTRTHTYVETRNGPLELFDNRADRYQLNNLAGQPAQAKVQSRLAARLRQLLDSTADRFEPREAYWKRYRLDIGDFGEVRYTTRPNNPASGRAGEIDDCEIDD